MLDNIKIGGMTYDILLKNLSTRSDDVNGMQLGWHILPENIIEINNNMCEQRKEQTLIHEMMHAVFSEAGINVEDEEDIVNRVSIVLYQVLKDNDFSWIGYEEENTEFQTKDGIIKN